MAIKSGQILHDAHGFVIDRIQTGGVNSLNIPVEKINELGNYQSVATVRDIPDLSFELQSFDMGTEMEALALRIDPTTTGDGDEFDFRKAIPMDIISPFKPGQGLFNIVGGIALPYLTLESVAYRFGLKSNAEQTFGFKGDSIFYIPGSPYYGEAVKSGTSYNFAHTAILYDDSGVDTYAYGVCWHHPTTKLFTRLFHGQDYTDTSAGFTLTADALALIPTGAIISWVYGSTAAATYPQSVHEDATVKPAAVRGRNIDIYVADGAATPVFHLWTSVQSFEANWRVTLDPNGEFGNSRYVSQDYDIPAVGGNIVVRPRDVPDLMLKLQQITDTASNVTSGPLSSQPLQVEARIYDPNATVPTCLKTLYVPDARFTPPAIQGRVGQKLEPTLPWESDGGNLLVYQGLRT